MFMRHELAPISVGPMVGKAEGRVIAAFRSSAYVATGAGAMLCLLPADAPDGAIHVRLAAWPALTIGDAVSLDLSDSARWMPSGWPNPSIELLHKRLDQFGAIHLGEPHRLLGRGPGLTPDGDDRLCGWLIMRRALGVSVDAEPLLDAASKRTHAVSQAHLSAAALGLGTKPFHTVLCHLLDERIDIPDLAALDGIGHGSGRAAFAGAMAAVSEFVAGMAELDWEVAVA